MQQITTRGVVLALPLNSPTSTAQGAVSRPQTETGRGPHLNTVWRNAVSTFVAQAAPLLALAVIGFVAVPLLGGAFAILSVPLARLLMGQLATQGHLRGMSWRQIPAALLVAWLYLTAMTLGQLGISVPLQSWGLDLNFADQHIRIREQIAPALVMRGVDALSAEVDSPLKSDLRNWRNTTFAAWESAASPAHEQTAMAAYWQRGPDAAGVGGLASLEKQNQSAGLHRLDLRLLFVAGCLVMFIAESLFAFRSLPGIPPLQQLRHSLLHLGDVAGQLLLLKFVTLSLKAVFVFAPLLMEDCVSDLARNWHLFGSPSQSLVPVQALVLGLTLALLNAVAATFEAVYAACLYQAISSAKQQSLLQPA